MNKINKNGQNEQLIKYELTGKMNKFEKINEL